MRGSILVLLIASFALAALGDGTNTTNTTISTTNPCGSDSCTGCQTLAGCAWCDAKVQLPAGVVNGICRLVNATENVTSICTYWQGTVVGPSAASSCPAPSTTNTTVTQICTAKGCRDCLSDSRCGFCAGQVSSSAFGVCGPLLSDNANNTLTAVCANLVGSVLKECPAVVAVNNTATTGDSGSTTGDSNGGSTCSASGCNDCLSSVSCGICTLSSGGLACRAKTTADSTGGAWCASVNGTWSDNSGGCNAINVANAINSGNVSESDINDRISHDNNTQSSLSGLVVIVTVITQASTDSNGTAHFTTIVDVSGNAQPTQDQLNAVCNALESALATELNLNITSITCTLKSSHKKRQSQSYSYQADLAVAPASTTTPSAGQGANAGLVVPGALSLVALAVVGLRKSF